MKLDLPSLHAELKRRKVWRVAAAYAVVGFVIWQVAEIAFPALHLPDGALTLVVVLTLLGFPIALVLAWAYDVTPAGIERTPSAAPAFEEGSCGPPAVEDAAAASNTAVADPARTSVVVLPFDDMSPNPEDAWFADGLTEEIITDLSCCRRLRVISRNSAMALKGTRKDTRTIARELGVEYVLEGSVRKAGDELRITAQLIDARADEHIWAEKYDDRLENVFAIQSQVSRRIVDSLMLQLSPEEQRRLAGRPIGNVAAWECWYRARGDMWLLSEESLDRALAQIDRGLRIAGDNDQLHAMKGLILMQYVNTMSRPPDTYAGLLQQARECADRALVANPASAPGHSAHGFIAHQAGDARGAAYHFSKTVALDPNSVDAVFMLGFVIAAGGADSQRARWLLERAATLDPLTPMNQGALGWLHIFENRYREALDGWVEWQATLEQAKSAFRFFLVWLHGAAGNFDEAFRLVEQIENDSPGRIDAMAATFVKHAWRGEKRQALEAVTPVLEQASRWDDLYSLLLAGGHARIGEPDRAFHWLEHAIDYGFTNVPFLERYEPFIASLRSDARFAGLLAKADRLSRGLGEVEGVRDP